MDRETQRQTTTLGLWIFGLALAVFALTFLAARLLIG